eukprot:4771146-Amphidinium_carterae.2
MSSCKGAFFLRNSPLSDLRASHKTRAHRVQATCHCEPVYPTRNTDNCCMKPKTKFHILVKALNCKGSRGETHLLRCVALRREA